MIKRILILLLVVMLGFAILIGCKDNKGQVSENDWLTEDEAVEPVIEPLIDYYNRYY